MDIAKRSDLSLSACFTLSKLQGNRISSHWTGRLQFLQFVAQVANHLAIDLFRNGSTDVRTSSPVERDLLTLPYSSHILQNPFTTTLKEILPLYILENTAHALPQVVAASFFSLSLSSMLNLAAFQLGGFFASHNFDGATPWLFQFISAETNRQISRELLIHFVDSNESNSHVWWGSRVEMMKFT